MARRTLKRVLALGALCLALGPLQAGATTDGKGQDPATQEWRFRVFLDDKEIGYHNFRVTGRGDHEQVEIEASFNVRFLFFNAYRYRHDNVEQWRGDCLDEMSSSTRAGRDEYRVTGVAGTDQFSVNTLGDTYALETDCVRTFAYWDPVILESRRLLNAQTGEWIEVSVSSAGAEVLEIQGQRVTAQKYDLNLPQGMISVWYGPGGEWLTLQAPAPGGRVLKYVPERLPESFDFDSSLVSR